MPTWSKDCARVVVEVSSASPASPDPVWVDISTPGYVLSRGNGGPIDIDSGRQDETSQTQPSRLSLTLDNRDNRFVPHNPSSPYYPWWEQGRRIRVRETLGPVSFDLFDGYIEMPQVIIRPPTDVDNWVTVTAVDRLGRLERARKLVSVLTEHVRYYGGTALQAYWPLNDADGALAGNSLTAGVGSLRVIQGYDDTAAGPDQIQFGQVDGPVGDDARYVEMNAVIGNSYNHRLARRDINVPLTSEMVGIVLWVRLGETSPGFDYQVLVSHANSFLLPTFQLTARVLTNTWEFFCDTNLGNATLTLGGLKPGSWQIIGMFLATGTGQVSLWVDGQTAAGTAAAMTTSALQEVAISAQSPATSVGHVQVYGGTAAQLSHDWFAAQYEVGLLGLDRQRVDERIRTILNFAGVTDAELQLEVSPTVMQPAAFAGQGPVDLARAATATDGGVLFTDGPEIVFQSRKHRYDI